MLEHNPMQRCLEGERYTADFPDTLDLAGRMALAINALTNAWVPEERWALQFDVSIAHKPPVIWINHLTDAYLNIPAKFLEALVVCRTASGSDLNLDTDLAVLRTQLELLGEDGLTYCPTDTLPKLDEPRPFAEIWGEGRLLLALCMLSQIDDDPVWLETARRKVDRMLELSTVREDFRFYWRGRFVEGAAPPPDADEPRQAIPDGSLGDQSGETGLSLIYSVGALGHGAALLYRLSGYAPALELARGLARWALARVFKHEDGHYDFYHFHHGLYALMAVCEYGVAANDREVLQRVDSCYRWAREMGDPLIGFYAEVMPGSDIYLERRGNTVEICEVADMVFLALTLTRAGLGDYMDDVDRWVRNMYAEGQVLDADFINDIPESNFIDAPHPLTYPDTRNVLERSVGSFLGWMRANEGFERDQTAAGPKLTRRGIMHCCTANGARAFYFVWDSIVQREADGSTRVNLLLNRASPWLDVASWLPVEGRVQLRIKDAPRVSLRLPEWVDRQQLRASVNGAEVPVTLKGRLAQFEGLAAGDLVELHFPVPERRLHRVIGELPYRLTLRGANVVAIEPRGVSYPLFDRPDSGELREQEVFVPARSLTW